MTPVEKAAGLDFWSEPVDPIPLGGGRTNTNFLISIHLSDTCSNIIDLKVLYDFSSE